MAEQTVQRTATHLTTRIIFYIHANITPSTNFRISANNGMCSPRRRRIGYRKPRKDARQEVVTDFKKHLANRRRGVKMKNKEGGDGWSFFRGGDGKISPGQVFQCRAELGLLLTLDKVELDKLDAA